jgi:Arc/MetJ family transcription regulator
MSRVRVSTTVDGDLLTEARRIRSLSNDATLIDEALRSLIARNRSGEIDATYAAYDQFPVDNPDDWGSLDAFRKAAAAS